jgi:transposase
MVGLIQCMTNPRPRQRINLDEQGSLLPLNERRWMRQSETDQGKRNGTRTTDRDRLRELEREVRELKQANKILRKAAAFIAQAELGRSVK